MRYVTFEHVGRLGPGLLTDEGVMPLLGARRCSTICGSRRTCAGPVLHEAPIPFGQVRLLAPLRPHKNVFCVGRNYSATPRKWPKHGASS